MALKEEDWEDIFRHLRTEVRETGLQDVDDHIFDGFRSSADARENILSYVEKLIWLLKSRSANNYERVLNKISENVDTDDGKKIEGIVVAVSDNDYSIFGQKTIDLKKMSDLSLLIEGLEKLKLQISLEQ